MAASATLSATIFGSVTTVCDRHQPQPRGDSLHFIIIITQLQHMRAGSGKDNNVGPLPALHNDVAMADWVVRSERFAHALPFRGPKHWHSCRVCSCNNPEPSDVAPLVTLMVDGALPAVTWQSFYNSDKLRIRDVMTIISFRWVKFMYPQGATPHLRHISRPGPGKYQRSHRSGAEATSRAQSPPRSAYSFSQFGVLHQM